MNVKPAEFGEVGGASTMYTELSTGGRVKPDGIDANLRS